MYLYVCTGEATQLIFGIDFLNDTLLIKFEFSY